MLWNLILVSIGIFLAACNPTPKPPEENKTTLFLNLNEEPLTLDPRATRTTKDLTLAKQLFEGLYRLDKKGIPQKALAKDVTISDDQMTYTFTLKDAFWSDGKKITAHDFIYAWKKVLDKSFATDYALTLYPIKNAKQARLGVNSFDEVKVKALDDNTLEVQLENPTPYFLELLCFPTTFPIQNHLDEKDPSWMLKVDSFVCNGPFKLEKKESHKELIFAKNPLYWDEKAVSLQKINFSIVEDSATEGYLFEKGKLDWLGQPLSQQIFRELLTKLKEDRKVNSYPVSGTFWLKFNNEKEPVNHVEVRRALSMAISREPIIAHVLKGNQIVATSILPPTISPERHSFFVEDKEAAKKLFQEHFKETNCPKITLSYFNNDRNSKIAQVIQDSWQQTFGITVVLDGSENQLVRQKMKSGDYMIALSDWIADYQDPLTFLEIFKDEFTDKKGNGLNDSRWYHARYASLCEKAKSEKDANTRKALLEEAEAILMSEMPVCPLYHYAFDYAKKENIDNVILSHLGIADYKYATKQ